MDFLPYLVVWLLLSAIPLAALFLARRPSILPILSIAFVLLALAGWFIARPSTPISFTVAPWPVHTASSGWGWQMDAINWRLTGIVLWLTLGLQLYLSAVSPATVFNQPSAVVGLLSAVLLPTLWSATPATLLTTWTLFAAICWLITHRANPNPKPQLTGQPFRQTLLPIALYAAAVLCGPSTTTLVNPSWSPVSMMLALLAMVLQLTSGAGAAPSLLRSGLGVAVALHLLPPLIGVMLLAHLVAAVAIPFAVGLLATVLGIAIVITGGWLAWVGRTAAGKSLPNSASGLALALAGLAFLTAIWTGLAPLLAAGQLVTFVPAALSVSSLQSPISSFRSSLLLIRPSLIAQAIAFLAIAGLPPTAGFASLAPLYATWMTGIHALLVVALLLLLIPLLAISYRFAQRMALRPLVGRIEGERPQGYRAWIVELAPLLLIAGVFPFGNFSPGSASIGVWLALFVGALGGLLLPQFLPHLSGGYMSSVRRALREALAFRPLPVKLPHIGRRLAAPLIDAFASAYAILESDAGLLWLLALLLLFWWIS